ncbi:GGDEF domain-containing protein [Legionella rubrilucens]|uniref:diguanylate cyclase n=1 Tax=Legionella rubrilucens TaxID=458 RepID=A0A0W0XY88_9GAMM|nr:GGDEF domain-containing protein [Legionella rubrilucens]KTD49541.1 GGDEF domain-containing protein [Legionella rubrilucens]
MIDPQLKQKIINTISKYEQRCNTLQDEINNLRQIISLLLTLPLGMSGDLVTTLKEDVAAHKDSETILTQVERLIATLTPAQSDHLPSHQAISETVNQSLKQLLSHLAIPEELHDKVEHVKTLLRSEITRELLPSVIDNFTKLVIDAFSIEQSQLKNYLQDLTSQLHDFDSYLKFANENSQQAKHHTQQLESGIATNINQIQSHVDKAKTIEELSGKISKNLATIELRIKEFKESEQQRIKKYEVQVQNLQQKLSESEKAAEEIKHKLTSQQVIINQDSLTGLPNRASYDEHIQEAYNRWQRGYGELSLAIADIDHFKKINDNYGHLAGDKVLKKVATLFKTSIRSVDFIARYGGEEFIFIFERTSEKEAKRILESLRSAVESCQFCYRDTRVDVTVSFGLTTFKPDEDIETLFMRADAAMYQAKRAGRNRVEVL